MIFADHQDFLASLYGINDDQQLIFSANSLPNLLSVFNKSHYQTALAFLSSRNNNLLPIQLVLEQKFVALILRRFQKQYIRYLDDGLSHSLRASSAQYLFSKQPGSLFLFLQTGWLESLTAPDDVSRIKILKGLTKIAVYQNQYLSDVQADILIDRLPRVDLKHYQKAGLVALSKILRPLGYSQWQINALVLDAMADKKAFIERNFESSQLD